MKLILAIALFALLGCNSPAKKESMSMPGAYAMLSQSWSDGKIDTTYTSLKQLKIYTDDHMMYANVNPADSISSFGVCTYNAAGDSVVEKQIYSASDTSSSDQATSFNLLIDKTPKGYKQVIPELISGNQKIKLTEEYASEGTAEKSALDGAWKEVKNYYVKGKDTTVNKITQYKTYYAGHFIFGHTYADSANKLHTGMGYGTFKMNGTDKVKEDVIASNYYQVRGNSFDIAIEMNGNDEFKQTITESDGAKEVEVYQRLKK